MSPRSGSSPKHSRAPTHFAAFRATARRALPPTHLNIATDCLSDGTRSDRRISSLPVPWRYAWVSISMSTPNADAWELAGFPGRLNVAAYLTADQLAAQYRVLLDVLLDAQEQSLTGVGRDDLLTAVYERIAAATDAATADRLTDPEVFDLDKRMQALHQWGVVIRW